MRQRPDDLTVAHNDWQRALALDPASAAADLAQQDLASLEAGPQRP